MFNGYYYHIYLPMLEKHRKWVTREKAITSFVATLEQCTQRFLLSLNPRVGLGCTSIGVIETNFLVSGFISFYYNSAYVLVRSQAK
jgi:hypothetical protein